MRMKGMKVYGAARMPRPYRDLSDTALAQARKAALKDGTDLRRIVDLNTETQLRDMVKRGAKLA